MARKTRVYENLRVDLSVQELAKIARTMGQKVRQLSDLEEEKKSAAADFKVQIDNLQAEINRLSASAREEHRYEDVACDWEYDNPEPGRKTLRRCDNGEVVRTEAMTDDERQGELFNSPEETEEAPAAENSSDVVASDSAPADPSAPTAAEATTAESIEGVIPIEPGADGVFDIALAGHEDFVSRSKKVSGAIYWLQTAANTWISTYGFSFVLTATTHAVAPELRAGGTLVFSSREEAASHAAERMVLEIQSILPTGDAVPRDGAARKQYDFVVSLKNWAAGYVVGTVPAAPPIEQVPAEDQAQFVPQPDAALSELHA